MGLGRGKGFRLPWEGQPENGRPSERAVSDGLLVAWVETPTQNR